MSERQECDCFCVSFVGGTEDGNVHIWERGSREKPPPVVDTFGCVERGNARDRTRYRRQPIAESGAWIYEAIEHESPLGNWKIEQPHPEPSPKLPPRQ